MRFRRREPAFPAYFQSEGQKGGGGVIRIRELYRLQTLKGLRLIYEKNI